MKPLPLLWALLLCALCLPLSAQTAVTPRDR